MKLGAKTARRTALFTLWLNKPTPKAIKNYSTSSPGCRKISKIETINYANKAKTKNYFVNCLTKPSSEWYLLNLSTMKNYRIFIWFFIIIFAQACSFDEDPGPVKATALLQYFLPNVRNHEDCFDDTTTFTKSFIESKTADDFDLQFRGNFEDKSVISVVFKNVKIKFAPNALNKATFMIANIETGGKSFSQTLFTDEEIEVSQDIKTVLEKTFNDALVRNIDVSLKFNAFGCSDDGSRIDGIFKVTLAYNVDYR